MHDLTSIKIIVGFFLKHLNMHIFLLTESIQNLTGQSRKRTLPERWIYLEEEAEGENEYRGEGDDGL